jgi:hypothetical protein
MKELHGERLDIPVLSVCSVVCDVQMIEVIRKESMVTALDPMRLDFILTGIEKGRKRVDRAGGLVDLFEVFLGERRQVVS